MNSAFHRIQIGGDWAYFDQLDGKNMEPGEYEVRWPDSSITRETVEIEYSRQHVQDMGHTAEIPVRKAYVVIWHRGVKTRIRAIALELRTASENEKATIAEKALATILDLPHASAMRDCANNALQRLRAVSEP